MSDPVTLRPYQQHAITAWAHNGYKGLFEMATGTGKTLTALSCAKSLQEKEGHIHLLILVPTLSLADQWMAETKQVLTKNVILANSSNLNWYSEALTAVGPGIYKRSYCIITTYVSFITQKFGHILQKMPPDTFLIADEVHNFGTESQVASYPDRIQRRLGLSATPNRYFDEQGSRQIFRYFGAESGPTFQFSMEEAIKEEYLCEYFYYPVVIALTEEELSEYKAISRKLFRYFNKETGAFKEDAVVTSLLLKRKKIIHKASGKFAAFRAILKELVAKNPSLHHVLVYVPEGNSKKTEKDDQRLIDAYSKIISHDFQLIQHQFIGGTPNRERILQEFAKGKIQVLTAMKCLDEGIDIKQAEIAIFCSSTGSPRQFIQRRGRILRTYPGKKSAVIYDLVVLPTLTNQYFGDNLQMEKSILQSELRRVQEFAGLAVNHYQALESLEEAARIFDLDIYSKGLTYYNGEY